MPPEQRLAMSLLRPAEAEKELRDKTERFSERFREAMDDDFNTALALGNVFDLIRSINRVIAEGNPGTDANRQLLAAARAGIDGVAKVLGVCSSKPTDFLQRIKGRKAADLAISPEEVEKSHCRPYCRQERERFQEKRRDQGSASVPGCGSSGWATGDDLEGKIEKRQCGKCGENVTPDRLRGR